MSIFLPFAAFLLLGYFIGSLPFALWVTRWWIGKDVRSGGSGHATTTNTIRQAGWAAGGFVLFLDIAKGFLPVWLAVRYGGPIWLPAVAAAGAVAGHCWPILAGFQGGMGLAVTGGAMLAVAPLGFGVGLATLVTLVLVMRHSARASVITGLLLPFIVWIFGIRDAGLWVAATTGLVVSMRFLIDWNRKYRELWLDREIPG